jgi:hypothetical protein
MVKRGFARGSLFGELPWDSAEFFLCSWLYYFIPFLANTEINQRTSYYSMRRQQIITMTVATLLAALGISCSRISPQEAALRQRLSIPAEMLVKDLGEIRLQPDTPRLLSLGKDRYCTVSATALTNDLLRMSLVYNSSNELVDGNLAANYSERSTFLLHRGQQCAPKMGKQLMVVMRPVLMAQ